MAKLLIKVAASKGEVAQGTYIILDEKSQILNRVVSIQDGKATLCNGDQYNVSDLTNCIAVATAYNKSNVHFAKVMNDDLPLISKTSVIKGSVIIHNGKRTIENYRSFDGELVSIKNRANLYDLIQITDGLVMIYLFDKNKCDNIRQCKGSISHFDTVTREYEVTLVNGNIIYIPRTAFALIDKRDTSEYYTIVCPHCHRPVKK